MFFITKSRQNKQKERKTGFSQQRLEILFIIAFTKQKKKKHSKDFLSFSLSLSLSLSVGKKYSLQEGTASDSFCAVYITAFQRLQHCVIIVSIISFHQNGERERERSEISLARTRESALGDTKQKTSLLVHFFFVSKTDSYRYSLLSKPPHGSNRVSSL